MKPRIGYDNLFVRFRGTLNQSATSTTGANLGNWLTGPDSSWLLPVSNQIVWVSVTPPTPQAINYFAVARHNLSGTQISVQRLQGSSWFTVASYTPPDNDAFMVAFPEVTAQSYRIQFDRVINAGQFLAVASIGRSLELERGLFVGHNPITENERNRYISNLSESGDFVGRKLISEGAQSSIDLSNISAEWARDHWRPFRKHAEKSPFFWQWNPDEWDDEVALCWTTGDPSLSNSGVGYINNMGSMSISMSVRGIVR